MGAAWTKTEDEALLAGMAEGKQPVRIARSLGRSEVAVKMRYHKLQHQASTEGKLGTP